MQKFTIILIFYSTLLFSQANNQLQKLATTFFEWRAITQPITPDDIPRIERPKNWVPDYSETALVNYRLKYLNFKKQLSAIDKNIFSKQDSVDFLLLRSAIERVNWELNILKLPNSHPEFYIQQTIGALFDLLVISSPMDDERARQILLRVKSIPKTLENAKRNLSEPIKPFADIAISQLNGIKNKLTIVDKELHNLYPNYFDIEFKQAMVTAAEALEKYSSYLNDKLPEMKLTFSVGKDNYNYFLKNIALVPYTPEEILRMGMHEWERAVNFEFLEKTRNKNIKEPKIFENINEQIEKAKVDEEKIRLFINENDLITIPTTTKHYTLKPFPKYLMPILSFGELDDFTSPTRLDQNSVRYIPEPSSDLPYFYKTAAIDPRPLIIHEGVPGHYFQLVQSWNNPNPIRRFYFDSNSNEGIGFYLEEMFLQLGLFDDAPHTREIIYSLMRFRALRVNVDVNLALGNYTIEKAAKYLAETVPMDFESALEGATFYAATPGQAISYQVGKIQLMKLLSDARVKMKEKFNVKKFNNYLMKNGNIPFSLMRWEYLNDNSEIKKFW